MADGDPLKDMPPCDENLVKCWHELGRCVNSGYGVVPLTFTEIKAYSDTVADLSSFEVSTLAMMSKVYVNEYSAATSDITRPAPHEGKGSLEVLRNNIAEAFKVAFKRVQEKKPA